VQTLPTLASTAPKDYIGQQMTLNTTLLKLLKGKQVIYERNTLAAQATGSSQHKTAIH